MKSSHCVMSSLILTGAIGLSMPALADDAPSDQPVKSHARLMHDCMAKQKAQHSGATSKAMKATCREEISSYNNHPSAPSPSSVPPPKN